LILRGENITIHSLDLDGALIIDVPNHLEVIIGGNAKKISNSTDVEEPPFTVRNAGWVRVPIKDTGLMNEEKEIIQMRGYKIERKETAVIKRQGDVRRLLFSAEDGCMAMPFDAGDCEIL